jgi:hypothetical protein
VIEREEMFAFLKTSFIPIILFITVPLLLVVAFFTLFERQVMASYYIVSFFLYALLHQVIVLFYQKGTALLNKIRNESYIFSIIVVFFIIIVVFFIIILGFISEITYYYVSYYIIQLLILLNLIEILDLYDCKLGCLREILSVYSIVFPFANNTINYKTHFYRGITEPVMPTNKLNQQYIEWFVGLVDAKGKFMYNVSGNSPRFTFFIMENKSNLKLLDHVATCLGDIGSITIKDTTTYKYRITSTNSTLFITKLFPIFEEFNLRTASLYSYRVFKEMVYFDSDPSLDKEYRLKVLSSMKSKLQKRESGGPISKGGSEVSDQQLPLTDWWLVGFAETRAQFEIYNVEVSPNIALKSKVLAHKFVLRCHGDVFYNILDRINNVFNLHGCLSNKPRGKWYFLTVTKMEALHKLIAIFKDKLVGTKAEEFNIWANSLNTLENDKLRHDQIELKSLMITRKFKPKQALDEPTDTSFVNNVDQRFVQWLVGFIEGDGNFGVHISAKNIFTFVVQVAQSAYNIRLLRFVSYCLYGLGQIGILRGERDNILNYRIRNERVLKGILIPLFEKYPLHTKKVFYYNLFKEILYSDDIIYRFNLKLLFNQEIPQDYQLPSVNNRLPSKEWIAGFTEAEGSFYITKRGNRYHNGFSISQKDPFILTQIMEVLGCKLTLVNHKNRNVYSITTSNLNSIKHLTLFYKGQLYGMKAVEFRIWCDAFYKYRNNHTKLAQMQFYMRNLRQIYKVQNFNWFKAKYKDSNFVC